MEENQVKRLITLRKIYKESECICDPVDYIMKKKMLLHAVVRTLLEPLEEYENEQKELEAD